MVKVIFLGVFLNSEELVERELGGCWRLIIRVRKEEIIGKSSSLDAIAEEY